MCNNRSYIARMMCSWCGQFFWGSGGLSQQVYLVDCFSLFSGVALRSPDCVSEGRQERCVTFHWLNLTFEKRLSPALKRFKIILHHISELCHY